MEKIFKFILPLIILSGISVSCNDFLDVNPDNRAVVDTPEKVARLLVSAYPDRNYSMLLEPASDNMDENDEKWSNNDLLVEAYYHWETDYESGNDKPESMWQSHYRAVANANLALDAITNLGNTSDLRPHTGEAYITRAFAHFCLANMFCKHYGATSDTDLGLPYMKKSETAANPQYDRGTVTELYSSINEDLDAALPLIDNNLYKVPKYHFNKQAAYAFATRFNLYYGKYDKVIEYANYVLGDNPLMVLRNWNEIGALSGNGMHRTDSYVDATNPATLLVLSTASSWGRIYGASIRYSHNQYISNTETLHSVGPWGKSNDQMKFRPVTYTGNAPQTIINKMGEYWKVTDQINNYGIPSIMLVAFTTDEVLLCRAEAYIMKGDNTNALKDINLFISNFTNNKTPLTVQGINDFYGNIEYFEPLKPTVKKKLNPDFIIANKEQENMLHCLLHLRRLLTIHEGLRWADIKRFGIEIHRRKIDENWAVKLNETLTKEDTRRALQLPISVMSAGLEPNPRGNN